MQPLEFGIILSGVAFIAEQYVNIPTDMRISVCANPAAMVLNLFNTPEKAAIEIYCFEGTIFLSMNRINSPTVLKSIASDCENSILKCNSIAVIRFI
jgi:hypothetical protein